MARTNRPKPTLVTVCDLCDEEIPEGEPDEVASLTHGYIARKARMPLTRRIWLLWPPDSRKRRLSWQALQQPENTERRYDFHAECVLRVIEDAIAEQKGTTDG